MCGIAGFVNMSMSRPKEVLKNMTNSLEHRGPDSGDIFYDDNSKVGLGHRRLSILDLSTNSNQPFHSHCDRYVMVYNGEVYNYKEIANRHNIVCKTSSDSEIILESFVKNGISFVDELNGMFSIAIWDKEDNKLYFFRDRLGIKPLYIYTNKAQFAFSSELKAISSLNVELSINHQAIASFLHLGYIPHPVSIYNECQKFPAGHYGILVNGHLEIGKYWSVESKISIDTLSSELETKRQLHSLLESSVEKRLISDVPLGTFLSGGIDSSLVTAIAQKVSPEPIKTFSIGFKDSKFNESTYAKKVASHLKTDHHEYILSERDAIQKITELLDVYDEPFSDSSAIPTLLVSEMAKKEVTVCLSGDGGDELFHGYGMYTWAKRLNNPLISLFRKPISFSLSKFGNQRQQRASRVFDYRKRTEIKSHIFSQEQGMFSRQEIQKLLLRDTKVLKEDNILSSRILDPMEKQSFYDIKNYLKDDLLVKVDRASMRNSLEVRVPLLDHNIVEFALNLDKKLKVRKGISKYLLKEILFDYVPSSYFQRPKWGFSIPLSRWLNSDLSYLIDKYLSSEMVKSFGICHFEVVTDLVNQFKKGKLFLYNRLWLLILLHKWFSDNLVQNENIKDDKLYLS